jgi:hypothetical protein
VARTNGEAAMENNKRGNASFVFLALVFSGGSDLNSAVQTLFPHHHTKRYHNGAFVVLIALILV